MAALNDADVELPKHPAFAQNVRARRVGLALVVLAGPVMAAGAPFVAASMATVGALFAWLAHQGIRNGPLVQLNNLAHDRIARGEMDAASALLARAELRAPPYVRRAIRVQQALVALTRGDAEAAIAAATDAARPGRSVLARVHEDRLVASALGIRAVAHAATGRVREAEDDAREAEQAEGAGADALGRAALARMVLAARGNDLDRLAGLVRASAREATGLLPRERVLVRAFRRMVSAGGSVYRKPARRDEATGEDAVRDWIGRLAPGAAAFVEKRGTGAGGEISVDAPSADAAAALANEQGEHAKKGALAQRKAQWRAFALAALLATAMIAVFLPRAAPSPPEELDDPEEATSPAPSPFAPGLQLAMSALFASAAGILASRMRRAARAARALREAEMLELRGKEDEASRLYRSLLGDKNKMFQGAARLGLAALAAGQADFEGAQREVEEGIAAIEPFKAWRAAASGFLLPELHGMRAYLLALQDHPDAANAELALIAKEFQIYPFATRTRHRVRLAQAVRANDLDAARTLAEQRTPEMPLSAGDELLGDLVLAQVGAPALAEGERERIATDLREDPALARWAHAAAPRLVAHVTGANSAGTSAPAAAGDAPSEEAAREALSMSHDEPGARGSQGA